jgi:hypothetical protein
MYWWRKRKIKKEGKKMLIEQTVFNFHEVGEKSFEEIKNECLVSFAVDLKIALTSSEEHIRRFWADSHVCYDGQTREGSLANYKVFQDNFGSKIKYNSKSIVFEETLHNGMGKPWSLQQTCMDVYGLEYVTGDVNHSGYYSFKEDNVRMTCPTVCCEYVGEKENFSKESEERLKNFYNAFSTGEFPFMTITVIRLGNKDHYFYRIHR